MLHRSDRPDQVALGDARQGAGCHRRRGRIRCRSRRGAAAGLRLMNHWLEPGVRPREGHAQHGTVVPAHVDLVANGAAGSAESISTRIAVLHDEVGYHAVPPVAVEEVAIDEPEKIGDRERGLGAEELDLNGSTLLGLDRDLGPGERVGAGDEGAHEIAILLHRTAGSDRVGRAPLVGGLGPMVLGPEANEVVAGARGRLQKLAIHPRLRLGAALPDGDDAVERRDGGIGERVRGGAGVHSRQRGPDRPDRPRGPRRRRRRSGRPHRHGRAVDGRRPRCADRRRCRRRPTPGVRSR